MTTEILIDTSALTHLLLLADDRRITAEAIERLRSRGSLILAPQTLFEFYAVATRSAENRGGFGLAPESAVETIRDLRALIPLRKDPERLLDLWTTILVDHRVVGRAAHDARLAAFAIGHGIEAIATRDRGGFARFGLEEVAP